MGETKCKKCKGSGKRWGLEAGTGSMGLGLPMAVGIALAKQLKGEEGTVYVLMSDGELQCGTFWESMAIANKHKLQNLAVIVDFNGLQAMGSTEDILPLSLESFNHHEINGHDFDHLSKIKGGNFYVAHTVKGKGVSFMEDDNLYHYKAPNEDEYLRAKEELCRK